MNEAVDGIGKGSGVGKRERLMGFEDCSGAVVVRLGQRLAGSYRAGVEPSHIRHDAGHRGLRIERRWIWGWRRSGRFGRIGRVGVLGGEGGFDLGVGGDEVGELGRFRRVDAAEAVLIRGGLAAVVMELIGVPGSTDCLEEDLRKAGESAEALGVAGGRIVEGVDEELTEELGDVFEVEAARIATDAATGRGTAFAAALGEGLLVGGIVEEAAVASRNAVCGAGLAVAGGGGAGGLRHRDLRAFRRQGVEAFRSIQRRREGEGRSSPIAIVAGAGISVGEGR
jgi:hypothetical protein